MRADRKLFIEVCARKKARLFIDRVASPEVFKQWDENLAELLNQKIGLVTEDAYDGKNYSHFYLDEFSQWQYIKPDLNIVKPALFAKKIPL